jgi:CubicO group peptidase (beta-lactamase class C family)
MMAAAAGYMGGYVLFPKKELGAAYDEAMKTRVFEPLGMKDTTFDWARAMKMNHAMGHALDVDGNPAGAVMELNKAVTPVRPAGAAWSTAHDLAKYLTMELAKGALEGGKRYIAEEPLLARRKAQVSIGEFTKYGMGLFIDDEYGVEIYGHGGDVFGYHSSMFWIPAANVGGVILGNGDTYLVRKAFQRKVLEVLYDGASEADEDVASAVAEYKQSLAKERLRLTIPADVAVTGKLAAKYVSAALGEVKVVTKDGATTFDFGGWKSLVASRKNDDGTVSLVTYAAGGAEVEFVVAERDGKRALVVRDAQHEYVYLEAK